MLGAWGISGNRKGGRKGFLTQGLSPSKEMEKLREKRVIGLRNQGAQGRGRKLKAGNEVTTDLGQGHQVKTLKLLLGV